MTRIALLKHINLMAAEAKDLTGSYPADEAKLAKKRINRTVKVLKLLVASTPDRMIQAMSPEPGR